MRAGFPVVVRDPQGEHAAMRRACKRPRLHPGWLLPVAAACAGCGPGAPPTVASGAEKLCSAYVSSTPGACPDCNQSIRVLIENDVSETYKLARFRVSIDGLVLCEASVTHGARGEMIPTGSALVPMGDHDIDVALRYAGNGYGVFAYLNRYRFDVVGKHAIAHSSDAVVLVHARVHEVGGASTPLEERLAIAFDEEVPHP